MFASISVNNLIALCWFELFESYHSNFVVSFTIRRTRSFHPGSGISISARMPIAANICLCKDTHELVSFEHIFDAIQSQCLPPQLSLPDPVPTSNFYRMSSCPPFIFLVSYIVLVDTFPPPFPLLPCSMAPIQLTCTGMCHRMAHTYHSIYILNGSSIHPVFLTTIFLSIQYSWPPLSFV